MRRPILVVTGVLLAFVGSSLALVLGLVAEAFSLPAETSLALAQLAATLMDTLQAGTAGATLGAGLAVLWTALIAACLVPVCIVAVIGEAMQLRSGLWSAGGTGALTAAMPHLIRTVSHGADHGMITAREGRFTLLLFLVGVVAGTIYWLVAGARTGDPR